MPVSGPSSQAIVRWAVPADAASIVALDAEVSPEPLSALRSRQVCDPTYAPASALVMTHEGQLQGFVAFTTVLDEATILAISIRSSRQGQGLGEHLLKYLLAELDAAGVHRVLLEVRVSNAAARALYHRCGFNEDGIRADYYPVPGGREDALLMSAAISGVYA